MTTTAMPATAVAARRYLPDTWNIVQEILLADRHEGHRLLLHLLDQVSSSHLTLLDIGIIEKSAEEEVAFVSKLESIALFAMLAERYGMTFGIDKQGVTFLTNADLFGLAQDLGIHVNRADLPWAMDVVGMDTKMHDAFELPPEILPLDVLFVIASRCRDWYQETVGAALTRNGRHRMLHQEEVIGFMKETLSMAYGTMVEELEAGSERELAYEVVRRSLGVSA